MTIGEGHNPNGKQGQPTRAEWAKIRKFGRRVKELRCKKLTHLKDVEKLGWKSYQHWSDIEAGRRNVSFATVIRIAKLLDVKLHDLFESQ